jgi:hypothetical protein
MDDVIVMRGRLGLPDASMVREGLEAACQFFRQQLGTRPEDWIDYFRGIDFHHPVRADVVAAGTRLARHVSQGPARPKPFLYFTAPGTSPTRTGTTFPKVRFEEYRATRPIRALVSIAASISFNNLSRGVLDPVSRAGGGTQYIIAGRDFAALSPVAR